MHFLKITQPGWEGFTGPLGPYVEFKDGVSTAPVPRNVADSLSGIVSMVELDDDGNEANVAGLAHRLVSESKERAPVVPQMARQSETDKRSELKRERAKRDPSQIRFYVSKELEAIADEKGIAGLRVIAADWGLKHRSITVLIQMILDAQAQYLAKRDERMQKASAEELPASLIGSNKFDASYVIGEKTVSLGDLVAGAHKDSGLSVGQWNALPEDQRDAMIQAQLEALEDLAKPPVDPQSLDPEAAKHVASSKDGEPVVLRLEDDGTVSETPLETPATE